MGYFFGSGFCSATVTYRVANLLDRGELRVAEPGPDGWVVNEWAKKAILLYFRLRKVEPMEAGDPYIDETIDRVAGLGWSQSLLSMSMHDHLLEIVASHGIADRFVSIDGLPSATGGLKARHLEAHLAKLQREPTTVLLIGDTPDDAMAGRGAADIFYRFERYQLALAAAAAAAAGP